MADQDTNLTGAKRSFSTTNVSSMTSFSQDNAPTMTESYLNHTVSGSIGRETKMNKSKVRATCKRRFTYPTIGNFLQTSITKSFRRSKVGEPASLRNKTSTILRNRSATEESTNLLNETPVSPETISKFLTNYTRSQVERMGIIYEMINCERLHCKAIEEFMRDCENKGKISLLDDARILFENHYKFLETLRPLQGTGSYIDNIGVILFTNLISKDLVDPYSSVTFYCSDFAASSVHPVPNFMQTVPLRLTKYMIQIEAIYKLSKKEDAVERTQIFTALLRVKNILTDINSSVRNLQNQAKLKLLREKLNSKSQTYFYGKKCFVKDLLQKISLKHVLEVQDLANNCIDIFVFETLIIAMKITANKKLQIYSSNEPKGIFPLSGLNVKKNERTGDTFYLETSFNGYEQIWEFKSALSQKRGQCLDILQECVNTCTENTTSLTLSEILCQKTLPEENIKKKPRSPSLTSSFKRNFVNPLFSNRFVSTNVC